MFFRKPASKYRRTGMQRLFLTTERNGSFCLPCNECVRVKNQSIDRSRRKHVNMSRKDANRDAHVNMFIEFDRCFGSCSNTKAGKSKPSYPKMILQQEDCRYVLVARGIPTLSYFCTFTPV